MTKYFDWDIKPENMGREVKWPGGGAFDSELRGPEGLIPRRSTMLCP